MSIPGPGRRGDDGGDGKPEPPRQAERSRRDIRSVATAPRLTHEPLKDVPRPDTEIDIPPVNASVGVVELPGTLIGLPTLRSQGREMGRGAGMGPGARGLGGIGDGGGAGDEAVGSGNGVTMPTVLREVKPSYTADAMRAKMQGVVMVQAIVREDGSVGQVRVVRSHDRTFGLDEEALKAVRNWRFSPGKRQGRNVAVIVEIELMFTLR